MADVGVRLRSAAQILDGLAAGALAPQPRASDFVDAERARLLSERERLHQEIADLRAELAAREAQQRNEDSIESVMQLLLAQSDASVSEKIVSSLEEGGGTGSVDVSGLIAISGLEIRHAEHHLLSNTGSERIRRYDVRGHSHGLPFQLQFTADERTLSVRSLQVRTVADAEPELGPFLKSVQQECRLRAFFRGFVRYATLSAQRGALLSALSQRLPGRLCAPLGRFSTAIPVLGALPVTLVWRLPVQADGAVQPEFDVVPRTSWDVAHADTTALLPHMRQHWQRLIAQQGIGTALEALVRLLTA